MVVSDSGSELTSNSLLQCADDHRVARHYVAPGKPVRNAFAVNGGAWQVAALCSSW
jgi:putative transposase